MYSLSFCSESSGKHTGPVWQLKWIEKERGSGDERAEVLVSISQDGRITQWSIRKGFESYGTNLNASLNLAILFPIDFFKKSQALGPL